MKNLYFVLFALSLFTVLPSCGDDENSSDTNKFTFDGTSYNLANGFYTEHGSNFNGTFDLDVILTDENISKTGSALIGVGNALYLDLNTALESGLEAGTYNWANSRETFTIVDGTVLLDFNYATFTGTTISITEGSVKVANSGTESTITLDLKTADGKTISGSWKGIPSTL